MGEPLTFDTEEHQNIYIALKLIEELYKEGFISKIAWQNILSDYAELFDVTKLFD